MGHWLRLWCTLLLLGATQTTTALEISVSAPFQAQVFATGLGRPRGLVIDQRGDVLVVSAGRGILALWQENNGTVSSTLIVRNPELTHGIELYDDHVYASSEISVFRWPYRAGQRSLSTGEEEIITEVSHNALGVPFSGHNSRTLVAADGILYVSIGSMGNVDEDSYRARIRSFELASLPSGGYQFADGTVFADGLRNEVGLAFDGRNRLWGVENGADRLERADLGGDIHNDNPAEEFNLFDGPVGAHYGYPFCWSEFLLPEDVGRGPITQWAWPSLANATITDAWCRNKSNNRPPAFALPAHSAPLGITFFNGSGCGKVHSSNKPLYSFGCEFTGHAFVALHGSWNRDAPTGFEVVRIEINATTGLPTSTTKVHTVFGNVNRDTVCRNTDQTSAPLCIRPVDLKFTKEGVLLVTSDRTGELIMVGQSAKGLSPGENPPPAPAPPSARPSPQGSGAFRVRALGAWRTILVLVVILLISITVPYQNRTRGI